MCTTLLTHEYTPHCMPQLYPMHTHAHNHHPQVQKLTKATAWTLPMWNTCMFMCQLLLFTPLIYIMPTGSKLPHVPRVQYFFLVSHDFSPLYTRIYTNAQDLFQYTFSKNRKEKPSIPRLFAPAHKEKQKHNMTTKRNTLFDYHIKFSFSRFALSSLQGIHTEKEYLIHVHAHNSLSVAIVRMHCI